MLADAWGTELGIPELLGMVLLGEGSRDITSDVHGMLSMGVLQGILPKCFSTFPENFGG